jgi:uncharacterized integral membrane protein
MRFISFLFLVVFAGAVVAFAMQNQHDVTVTYFQWGYTGSIAVIVAAAYLLGMLSGWSIVGILRRSLSRVTERPERESYATR